MDDCIFCQIINGRSPASRVYEDPASIGFMDIRPVNPGHVLVIPKRHFVFLSDLKPEEFAHLFVVAKKLAAAVRISGIPCEGVNLILADGEAAGQEIFHLHVHVIPRFSGDGFGFQFGPQYSHSPDRQMLDDQAHQIRSAFDRNL
jgi:histidine triad (HIT) family protein